MKNATKKTSSNWPLLATRWSKHLLPPQQSCRGKSPAGID